MIEEQPPHEPVKIPESTTEMVAKEIRKLLELLASQGITEEMIEGEPELKEHVDRALGLIKQGMNVPTPIEYRRRVANRAKRARKKTK